MIAREVRLAAWVVAAPEGEGYTHEGEIYWGVFMVDATDTRPVAMFKDEATADAYRRLLMYNLETNAEYDVSPCLLDISHRDNFEVPE